MADVNSIISGANATANDWVSQGQQFINNLSQLQSNLFEQTQEKDDQIRVDSNWQEPEDANAGKLADEISNAREFVKDELAHVSSLAESLKNRADNIDELSESLEQVSGVNTQDIESFTATAPTLSSPTAPTMGVSGNAPTAPTLNLTSKTIAAPVLPRNLDVVPDMVDIALPDLPQWQVEAFDEEAPDGEPSAPALRFQWAEEAYRSALLDPLKARLLDDLEHGGTGILLEDETRLWERAFSREQENGRVQQEGITREFAARGFVLPPGAMLKAIESSNRAMQKAQSEANRDIALKRSDLYQQNRQFTISQITQLEQVLMSVHGARMERMLQAEKAVADVAIAGFNAALAAYNAKLERFRISIAVYETRIRAATEAMQAARNQLEAARLQSDLQRDKIALHESRLKSAQMRIDLYRAELAAEENRMGIEKTRIDVFRSQVDAFVASQKTKELEMQLYEAQVRGDQTKIQLYEAQIRAYRAGIEAKEAKTETEFKIAQRQIEIHRQKLAANAEAVNTLRAGIGGVVDSADVKMKVNASVLSAFEANFNAENDLRKYRLAQLEGERKEFWDSLQFRQAENRRVFEQKLATQELSLKTTEYGAGLYTGVATSALSQINALVSQMSYS